VSDELTSAMSSVSEIRRPLRVKRAAKTRETRGQFRRIQVANSREIRWRKPVKSADVVGIFPNEAAVLRLAGAVLLEAHDEWAIADRRYLSEGSMALLDRVGDDGAKEVEGAKNLLLAS